jgi:hypothetical protein
METYTPVECYRPTLILRTSVARFSCIVDVNLVIANRGIRHFAVRYFYLSVRKILTVSKKSEIKVMYFSEIIALLWLYKR